MTRHIQYVAAAVMLLAAGCGTDAGPQIPPPLAGLQHAEVVRIGTDVPFDAQPSRAGVLLSAEGVIVARAAIVSYRFLAADGSAEEAVATPAWHHTFSQPGLFAISLTIVDDLGRTSTVHSQIHVAPDYTGTCTAEQPAGCASGRCVGDVCSRVACADQAVCPGGTTCAEGVCYVSPPTRQAADALYGADGGATGIDAADVP